MATRNEGNEVIEGLFVLESNSWLAWQLWDAAVARRDTPVELELLKDEPHTAAL